MTAALIVALTVGAAQAGWMNGGHCEVPLERSGHAWLVHATIDGVPGRFLLDTGASVCVVGPGMAERGGVRKRGDRIELSTANGRVRAPVATLRTLEVGTMRVRDVEAVVFPAVAPPLDGIIGLSFLDRFSYAIDPGRRVLRLAE